MAEQSIDGVFFKRLQSAVALRSSSSRDIPRVGYPSAVLILFAPDADRQGEPSVLFVLRTETVESHKGQVAFPGGRCEPKDDADAGVITTALRETFEEVGILPSLVEVVGCLPEVPTITGYLIWPVVGLLKCPLSEAGLQLQATEVAEAFWVPLSKLLAPETYRREAYEVSGVSLPIDVFQTEKHRIWGVTGAILRDLLNRLERT